MLVVIALPYGRARRRARDATTPFSSLAQNVTLTATVTSTGGTANEGTVTFTVLQGATVIGSATTSGTVSNGTASVSYVLPAGQSPFAYTIQATYNGTANFNSSSNSGHTLTVNSASTSTNLMSSPNPSTAGQLVTFTATVICVGGFTLIGAATFEIEGTPSQVVPLGPGGTAAFTTSGLSPGSYGATASFSSDSECSPSTSSTLTQLVNSAAVVVSLMSFQNPSTAGQSVTFTATVTCTGFTTTGDTVTFKDGSTTLGMALLNGSGQASLTTSGLSVGSHSMTAVYPGDSNCATSTSPILTQVVNTVGAGTALASSVNPSTAGQSVTFTATVTCSGFTPSGSVTFSDGGMALATVTLSGGSASFSTSTLAAGSHAITAAYSGDTNCAAGTSAVLTQVVGTPSAPVTPPAETEVALSYCYPAANAPPPGVPCLPSPPPQIGPPLTFVTFCLTASGLSFSAQGCGSHPPAPLPNGGHLPGHYCTNPDGSELWVTEATSC